MSILRWFDDRIAAELRLWDAIDQHRLSPFYYYGIHDGLDLREVPWKRGTGYDTQGLSNLLTANDVWARFVIKTLSERLDSPHKMKALGFCAKAAIPEMAKAGGGAIVNVSSANAIKGRSGMAQYDATKAAVLGLTRSLAHALVGMVIGGLVALQQARPTGRSAPLTRALGERLIRFGNAFRRIVFAQVRISLLNTALTAIYLLLLLPVGGIRLPLVKTMIAVTFVAGLLPVIGNLISNTVIVTLSLSHSLAAAVGSLTFLVVIHKLEYFLNARIVGGQIRASAWELLLVMMTMEAAFGIPGLIAAPIYYAYLKDELVSAKQI